MTANNDNLKKGLWTAEEDNILTVCVGRFKEGNWSTIALKSGLCRSGKSCRLRWVKHLSPNVKNGPLTEEEQHKVIKLQAKYGNKWALIANQLPGRSDNTIKNFWNSHRKRATRLHNQQQQQQQRSTNMCRGQSTISRDDEDGEFGMELEDELFPDNIMQMGNHGNASLGLNIHLLDSEGDARHDGPYFTSLSDDGHPLMVAHRSQRRSSSVLIHSKRTRSEPRSTALSMGMISTEDTGLLDGPSVSEGTSSSGSCVHDGQDHKRISWENMISSPEDNYLSLGMRSCSAGRLAPDSIAVGLQPNGSKVPLSPFGGGLSIKKEYMAQEEGDHQSGVDFCWMHDYNGGATVHTPNHGSYGSYGDTVVPALECSEPGLPSSGPMSTVSGVANQVHTLAADVSSLSIQHRPYPSKDVSVSVSGPDMFYGEQCTTPDMLNSRPMESPNLASMLASPRFDMNPLQWVH